VIRGHTLGCTQVVDHLAQLRWQVKERSATDVGLMSMSNDTSRGRRRNRHVDLSARFLRPRKSSILWRRKVTKGRSVELDGSYYLWLGLEGEDERENFAVRLCKRGSRSRVEMEEKDQERLERLKRGNRDGGAYVSETDTA
jgi:hypothetical protein